MNPDNDSYRPMDGIFPSKEHLDYWKTFLTLVLLALATPYMVILLFRNPGRAAAISSAI